MTMIPKAAVREALLRLAEAAADRLDVVVVSLMGAKEQAMALEVRREADAVRDCLRLTKALFAETAQH